jgi:hypothetical protein
MEMFAGLSVCVLVLTSLLIAIKTFAVWRRTRGLPELLLGTMLLSATVLGYPLAIATSRIPPSEMWALHFASQALFTVGYACLLLFTLRVFRANTPWATCLAGVTLLALVAGAAAYAIELSGENPRAPGELVGLTLLNSAAIAVAYFWTTLEAFRYHRQLRLRLRLGLSEVVVANRVLLWGLMSLAAGMAVIVSTAAMLAGSFLSPPIVLACSVLGLVHAGCLFLAFHPPAWYRSWLEQGSAAATGAA